MANMLTYLKCLLNGHRWFAPDLAHFEGQQHNVFTVRCDDCGYKKSMTGQEIQDIRKQHQFMQEILKDVNTL